MPSQEKKDKVKQIRKWFEKSDELLVLHYKGLTVSEANELRMRLKGMGSQLKVLKNTLTRIAVADTPSEPVTPLLEGPVAVIFIEDDAAVVARAVREFGKGRKDFYLLGGMLGGRVLTGRQVETFATLPPREVLLAQMAGVMQAPMSRMLATVVAPARKMLGLFQALADKKGPEAPAESAQGDAPVEEKAEIAETGEDEAAKTVEAEASETGQAAEPEAAEPDKADAAEAAGSENSENTEDSPDEAEKE